MNDEYKGYFDLWYLVILTGIKDKDIKYINSEGFEYHCHLIGVDPILLRKAIFIKQGDNDEQSDTIKCR